MLVSSLFNCATAPQVWRHQLLGCIPVTVRGEPVERCVTEYNVRTRLSPGFGFVQWR